MGLADHARLLGQLSNAELVARVAGLCEQYDRSVASCAQARDLLGLAAA